MEHTHSSSTAGDETKRQLSALENVPQETVIVALKANIKMSAQGSGLTTIQNGPYLQRVNLIKKSPAANGGKLKPVQEVISTEIFSGH
ncbi:PDZ domain-containing protein 9 [Colius striatus]|uniref:PDZ domain-containing protein 9 n=1 Tax=Colius striatus TaxID=57412 RepID=UPI002B1DDDED|nr:PDZ domain-containing protein 9 [Colius striatus]